MAIIVADDIIPALESTGIAKTIRWLANQRLDESAFMEQLNEAIAPHPPINWPLFLRLYADLTAAGKLTGVTIAGASVPAAVARPDAPADLGQDEEHIACKVSAEPDEPTEVRWYVNGVHKFTSHCSGEERNVAMKQLGCVSGDMIQACVVRRGVVGWLASLDAD